MSLRQNVSEATGQKILKEKNFSEESTKADMRTRYYYYYYYYYYYKLDIKNRRYKKYLDSVGFYLSG
jgi:hypothetical protein